ncbi:MAG: YicC family protein [Spirochaeta sp. LUC14_002_19_P3]|nr:MAG: YicC family protein [Spirochaeta sp. LUC14_002_19_P3]
MNSMTGFGCAEGEHDGGILTAELKSLNNRYLDIAVSLPSTLSALEGRVRELLQNSFQRGRLELCVRMKGAGDAVSVRVDRAAALAWKAALEELSTLLGGDINPDIIARQEGVFTSTQNNAPEAYWLPLESLIKSAVEQVHSDRRREGIQLFRDIELQLEILDSSLVSISDKVPQIKSEVNEGLKTRFRAIVGSEVDESRILTEIAAWLIKLDINEEIIRMRTHLDAFREGISSKIPKGKKLDFLSQEINREINTIGSKVQQADISHLVVNMKDAVEKIREQLRNVE